MSYYTNVGPLRGPVRSGEYPFAIAVLDSRHSISPVGMAFGVGRTDDSLAVWRLTVDGAEVPGRFVIVDREFRPVGSADPRLPTARPPGRLVPPGER